MRRTDEGLNEAIDLSETIDFKEEDTQIKKKQREKTKADIEKEDRAEEKRHAQSFEEFYAEALEADEGRGNLTEEFIKVCKQFNIALEEEKKKEKKDKKKTKTSKKDKKPTKKKDKKKTKKKNKKKGGK